MRPTTHSTTTTYQKICKYSLRSWVPNFQRIQNFRLHSYFNLCSSAIEVYYQDIILNEIASDESHFTFWDHFGLETLQSTLAILYWSNFWIFNFLNETKNDSTHGFRDGAVKLSWQEGPNSYYGRKRKLVYELRKCYEITSRREYATLVYYKIPTQTLLIDGERWLRRKGMNLNNSRQFGNAMTGNGNVYTIRQLNWKEGMPTLRMF
jgi:hypothetical protein